MNQRVLRDLDSYFNSKSHLVYENCTSPRIPFILQVKELDRHVNCRDVEFAESGEQVFPRHLDANGPEGSLSEAPRGAQKELIERLAI